MADDESTTAEVEVDSSEDVELEDIEVSLEDMDGEEPEAEEADEESEPEAESESEETEDEVKQDSEEPEEKVQSDEERQKAFNREMAERRIQEKKQKELAQKEQQQEYVAEAEDERDLALRQLQVEAYNTKVDTNTSKLTTSYEKALKDFDILNDTRPEVKAEVDAALDAFQALYVTIDAYGNPTEIRGNLYEYLQTKADSISKLTGIRSVLQKENKVKEKSKTFTPPSKAPKVPKVDPDLQAFDEEAYK